MTAPLTTEAIAAMVADAEKHHDDEPLPLSVLANVRALAAELTRLRAGADEILDEHEKDLEALHEARAQLEAVAKELKDVTKDRDKIAKWSVEAIDKLEGANGVIDRYADHKRWCSFLDQSSECSCGYRKALEEHLATQERK